MGGTTRERNLDPTKVDVNKMADEMGLDPEYLRKQLRSSCGTYNASTVEDMKEAYLSALWDEDKKMAMRKWETLSLKQIRAATNAQEARASYLDSPEMTDTRHERTDVRQIAFDRWTEFSLKQIEDAVTIEEAKDAYKWATRETRGLALCKVATFYHIKEEVVA